MQTDSSKYWVHVRPALLLGLLVHHILVMFLLANEVQGKPLNEQQKSKLRAQIELGWRFMTIWNFFTQAIYMAVELLALVFKDNRRIKLLQKLNWLSYWSLIWPYTIYIMAFFWFLYFYDRELIFPKVIDLIIPPILNHCVHTFIIVLLIIEHWFTDKKPPKFTHCAFCLMLYSGAYGITLNYTYLIDGVWLYGFLKVISWPSRIAYYLSTALLTLLFLRLGVSMQNFKLNRKIRLKSLQKLS